MSGDEKRGVGAEVGVNKMNEDGETVESSGFTDTGRSRGWYIFWLLMFLGVFGVWKIIEIILSLI